MVKINAIIFNAGLVKKKCLNPVNVLQKKVRKILKLFNKILTFTVLAKFSILVLLKANRAQRAVVCL
jgi:hypothetical protein